MNRHRPLCAGGCPWPFPLCALVPKAQNSESKRNPSRVQVLNKDTAMETTSSLPTPPPLPAARPFYHFPDFRLEHPHLEYSVSRQRVARRSLSFPRASGRTLIVWLAKRDDSPEIDAHGKESVNFQISMLIYNAIAAVFCLILIGFFFLAVLWVLNAVFVIIAAIQASDGKFYRYPMTIRFIQ